MTKVLILCAHRPKRSPSQRYRFEQYLPFLETKGFAFTFSFLLDEKEDKVFYSAGNFGAKVLILLKSVFIRIKDCFRFKHFDIILIQREATFFGTSFFERMARTSGTSVIFDFDDSIWLADTSPGNKKWEFIKKPAKFFKNVSYAHAVIAGNRYLAETALTRNKNTVIIPTTIDTGIHIPKPELRGKEQIIIGWSGSISTVKHFESLVPVLIRLKDLYGGRVGFKMMGCDHFSHPGIVVQTLAWSEYTEVDTLNSFDIGIMPLPDDAWANGKCGLKALSYMACEVPSVLSAVGVNKEIITHGENGFLVASEEEWLHVLCTLIEDASLRDRTGKAGRKTVLDYYSVQANQKKYLEVFNKSTRISGKDIPA